MSIGLPFSFNDVTETDARVTAVYLVTGKTKSEIIKAAEKFAIGQTIGTWVDVPGITEEMKTTYIARVTGVYYVGVLENGQPASVIEVAFPARNFEGSVAMLQTALMGNDVSTSLQLKLLDLRFNEKALIEYSGPKKSIAGVREITGVYGRPLVLNMIKPSLGHTPEVGARLFFETAVGGVDLIKDDEVLSSIDISPFEKRVAAYNAASDKACEVSGKRTLYIANITGASDTMRRRCETVLKSGGKAVMINFIATGYDALKAISDEFGKDLIIMGHYAGCGAMTSESGGYDDRVLLGILPRLCGTDIIMTMYPGEKTNHGYYNYQQAVLAQQLPLHGIKPVLTAVGGGVTPFNIEHIVQEFGNDVVLGVGGAIQGHPGGATKGAMAFMRMLKAIVENEDINTVINEDSNLRALKEMLNRK